MKTRQRSLTNSKRTLNYRSYTGQMVYRRPAELSRNTKRSWLPAKFKLFILAAIVLGIGGHILWAKHVSAQTAAEHRAQIVAAAEAKTKAATFASQVNALITTNPNDSISVATASATQGVQTYGDSGVFDGASTAKLLTAADFLHHVEAGTASLNQQIDGHTAGYWLKTMLVNSDDTAWSELNGFLTHDDLATYANKIDFVNYDPSTNTFTAGDTALLLQKLYDGELLNSSDRSLLLKYLSQANYRQYIVAAVPSGNTVYHKVGVDNDTINDAAVISNGQKYVVLVIFTDGNGSYDWPNRTQLIHSLTQDAIAAYL